MRSEISLRPLNSNDAKAVAAILKSVQTPGLPHWSVDQIIFELRTGAGIGAFLPNDELVGFILFHPNIDHVDISYLASRHDMQNQGIMTRLMQALMHEQKTLPLWLEVHEGNLTARKFYEKLAFKEVGQRRHYYRDNGAAVLYSTAI